ncbi:MAG: glucose-6-phosphate dehydrogenase [Bacteroidales bacterium]
MREEKMNKPDSYILVIFGASGDLTSRKLLPALFKLFCRGMMPDKFAVLGVSRTSFTDDTFRDKEQTILEATLTNSQEKGMIGAFFSHLHYLRMDTKDAKSYDLLTNRLDELTLKLEIPPNYLFYLATPPAMYSVIPKCLAEQGLQKERNGKYWRRIIVEKPYGRDLKSALALDKLMTSIFKESQIYRIDHYLGKETVQNIMVFRFANGIFEPLWNRNYINYIEITAVENMGVLDRAGYYDSAGALRDMVQNHLMQLLGVTAMEPPAQFNGTMFRDEIHKVLRSLKPIPESEVQDYVVRGQYTEGDTLKGHIKSYREEANVSPESRTETFVALKVFIDNWRWSGVPFYIRTGKAMPTKVSEIVVHFNATPYQMFEKQCSGNYCNKLIIRILPDEGIQLQFGLKLPGSTFDVKQVTMDFKYEDILHVALPEAYERLLLDCMLGDPMLYSRTDSVEASWRYIQPILEAWENNPAIPLYGYSAGTWGPLEQNNLMTKGRTWTNPCKNLTNAEKYCLL